MRYKRISGKRRIKLEKQIITGEACEPLLKHIQPALNSRQNGSIILYFDKNNNVFWEHSISEDRREAQLMSLTKKEVNQRYTENFGNMMNKKTRC